MKTGSTLPLKVDGLRQVDTPLRRRQCQQTGKTVAQDCLCKCRGGSETRVSDR